VDIDDCPSVISVVLVVYPVPVLSEENEWSDTLAVPIVGRVVTP